MNQCDQLSLTPPSCAKTMLAVCKNFVLTHMFHHVADDYMFQELAA